MQLNHVRAIGLSLLTLVISSSDKKLRFTFDNRKHFINAIIVRK